MNHYPTIRCLIALFSLLCFPFELVATNCLNSIVRVNDILTISHEAYFVGSSKYFVNITAPSQHKELPFSHMVISRGELELSASLRTTLESKSVYAQVDGTKTELDNWTVSVFYKQSPEEGENQMVCSKTFMGVGKLGT